MYYIELYASALYKYMGSPILEPWRGFTVLVVYGLYLSAIRLLDESFFQVGAHLSAIFPFPIFQ